jgi:hypothetical protein
VARGAPFGQDRRAVGILVSDQRVQLIDNLHSVVYGFVDSHTGVDVSIDGAPVIRNRSFERSDISVQVVDRL